jgi:hypothetical protein
LTVGRVTRLIRLRNVSRCHVTLGCSSSWTTSFIMCIFSCWTNSCVNKIVFIHATLHPTIHPAAHRIYRLKPVGSTMQISRSSRPFSEEFLSTLRTYCQDCNRWSGERLLWVFPCNSLNRATLSNLCWPCHVKCELKNVCRWLPYFLHCLEIKLQFFK